MLRHASPILGTAAIHDQSDALATALMPMWQVSWKELQQEPVRSADETAWTVRSSGKSRNKGVYAWVAEGSRHVGCKLLATRSTEGATDISVALRVDGLTSYPAAAKGDEGSHPASASPTATSMRAGSTSSLAKAKAYLLNHEAGLRVLLVQPTVALDHNAPERALRGLVLGRKTCYGPRSRRGTETTAILSMLVESACKAGVNPRDDLHAAARHALSAAGGVLLAKIFRKQVEAAKAELDDARNEWVT